MKTNRGLHLSHGRASDRVLWIVALAAVWWLIDYPVGLALFAIVATLHRVSHA
jgi:hypothetical protein